MDKKGRENILAEKHDTSMRTLRRICKIDYFSGSGKGGQHRNRHCNCVRLHYPPLEITVIATEHRSQSRNRKLAFKRLIDKINEAELERPMRVPTEIPYGTREKIKENKIKQSIKKRLREKFKFYE